MKSLKGLGEMNLETVEGEIAIRKDLLTQMVGSLYPSIIVDELSRLYVRQKELMNEDE